VRASLLTSLASLALSLVLAEVGLRLFLPVRFREPPARLPRDAWMELLHRRSELPELSYELAPRMHKRSHGTVIRTNSHGMREREIAIEKPDSVTRIAVLGDSYTFGFGVPGLRAYPRVLEGLLNQRASRGRRFEVLNFGVGGYSTHDEAVVLKYRALAWDPDLVVVGYVLNDPEDEPIQPLHSYYQQPRWWQRFHLLRLVAKAEWQWGVRRFGGGDYIQSLYGDPRKWRNVVDAFASIRQLALARGVGVMVVIFPLSTVDDWAQYPYAGVHLKVARAAAADGFEVVDLLPVFACRPPTELRLTDSDAHPNEEGHRLAAEAIAARLLADQFTGRSARPSGPNAP
jgi:lysophospholipase L1-like esterase